MGVRSSNEDIGGDASGGISWTWWLEANGGSREKVPKLDSKTRR